MTDEVADTLRKIYNFAFSLELEFNLIFPRGRVVHGLSEAY